MKGIILSLILFTGLLRAHAQVNFRTVAPQDPVVAGESFEIQYIVDGVETVDAFIAPVFTGFRFVTGPHIYKGAVINLNTTRPLVNTVYTLAAVKPGRYLIHGARVTVGGSELNSNDVSIEVISKEEAFRLNKRKDGSFYSNSEYFLRPGEDPIEKIKQNLFLKVFVDKRSCYVGQPIVATYKLYSRLESQSDIVKNPGFYGFAVCDMINLADKAQASEIINGKKYDVHTVRKVQLYPLQAGQYTIDPMELNNKVEFSRSEVNRKTEQEIAEGVLNNAHAEFHNNTEVYENATKTEPVPVMVKPLPAKNKTDSFTAAVGSFTITAKLEKNEIAKNEQSLLVISIKGKGNFTQLTPPAIIWPKGIDAFEPVIKDSIDRLQVPLAGTKTFRYAFVSGKPGDYEIPAVELNFFDPDTNHFVKMATRPLAVSVNSREKVNETIKEKVPMIKSTRIYWWMGALVIGMLAILGLLARVNKKAKRKLALTGYSETPRPETRIAIDTVLESPQMHLMADNNAFYRELRTAIWEYFRQKMNVSGSAVNKPVLIQWLEVNNVEHKTITSVIGILNECETFMYTDAVPGQEKEELFVRTKFLLKEIDGRVY